MSHLFFEQEQFARFSVLEVGAGRVRYQPPSETASGAVRLSLEDARADRYSNAQLWDYQGRARDTYPWRPPLRMTVRAAASASAEQLRGTAGFGFWNQPFLPGAFSFRLPRYVWFFFGSPPHNMAFAQGVPGSGWKAACADFSRLPFKLLAPFAPLGFLLMRVPALYRALWPIGQRAIGAAEASLPVDMRTMHTYELEWRRGLTRFYVDGALILESPFSPRGPLGFVLWMDNQYAVVTPQGRLGWGVLPVAGAQWLDVESIHIEAL